MSWQLIVVVSFPYSLVFQKFQKFCPPFLIQSEILECIYTLDIRRTRGSHSICIWPRPLLLAIGLARLGWPPVRMELHPNKRTDVSNRKLGRGSWHTLTLGVFS